MGHVLPTPHTLAKIARNTKSKCSQTRQKVNMNDIELKHVKKYEVKIVLQK